MPAVNGEGGTPASGGPLPPAAHDSAAVCAGDGVTLRLQEEAGTISVGAGITLAGSFTSRALGLAANVLLTHLLGATGYGLWMLARSVVSVGEMVATLGLGDGVTRFVALADEARDASRLSGALVTGRSLALASSVVCTAATVLAAPLIATRVFHEPSLTTPIRLLALGIALSALLSVYLAASRGLQAMSHPAWCRGLVLPGGLVLVALLCRLLRAGLVGVVVGQVVVSLAALLLAVGLGTRLIRARSAGATPLVEPGPILRFSLPLMLAGMASFAANYGDRMMVGAMLGPRPAGYYTAALQWAAAETIVLSAFVAVFAPAIARLHAAGHLAELARLLKTVTVWTVACALPACLLAMLLARPLMSAFGAEFQVASTCLVVLSLAALVNVGTGPVGAMVVMSGRSGVDLTNILLGAALTIGLTWLLVPSYGILGAAVANASSTILVNLLRLGETWALVGIHPYSRQITKPVIAAVPAALLCAWVFRAPAHVSTPWQALALLGLFGVIYIGLLLLQGLSSEDRAMLADLRCRPNRRV